MVLWLRMGVLKEPPPSNSLWLKLSALRLQSVRSPRKLPCRCPGLPSLFAGSGCSRRRLGSRLCSASSQRSEISLRMASTSAQSCPVALNNSSRLLLAVALSRKGSAVVPRSRDCVIISFYKRWGGEPSWGRLDSPRTGRAKQTRAPLELRGLRCGLQVAQRALSSHRPSLNGPGSQFWEQGGSYIGTFPTSRSVPHARTPLTSSTEARCRVRLASSFSCTFRSLSEAISSCFWVSVTCSCIRRPKHYEVGHRGRSHLYTCMSYTRILTSNLELETQGHLHWWE